MPGGHTKKIDPMLLGTGSCLGCESLLGLLNNGQLDTLALGKSHPGLCTFANDEHISQTCCKLMPSGILDMDGLKAALTLLPVLNDSDTSSVPSTRHHDNIPNIKLYEICDLVALQIELDSVVGLNQRIRVADGSPIISVEIWDSLLSKLHRPHLAELKLSLFIPN